MPMFGIKGKARRIASTEQVHLNPGDFMEDFNYEMVDGGWTHLEFESKSIRVKTLPPLLRVIKETPESR